ncbi:MAG: hypothetical protein ACRC1P_11055 [Cellulosilyticaceae bacterium]
MKKLLLLVILCMSLGLVGCGNNEIKAVSGMKVVYQETAEKHRNIGLKLNGGEYYADIINAAIQSINDFNLLIGYDSARVEFINEKVKTNGGVTTSVIFIFDNENKIVRYTVRDSVSILDQDIEISYDDIKKLED